MESMSRDGIGPGKFIWPVRRHACQFKQCTVHACAHGAKRTAVRIDQSRVFKVSYFNRPAYPAKSCGIDYRCGIVPSFSLCMNKYRDSANRNSNPRFTG